MEETVGFVLDQSIAEPTRRRYCLRVEEILGLVQSVGGSSFAYHRGQGHGIRGDADWRGPEGRDSEISLG